MLGLVGAIGALRFRLARLETGVLRPEPLCEPFMLLDDGTEVGVFTRGSSRYLLVDHRRDDSAPARIEFWEPLDAGEGGLAGLFTLCDAARPALRR